KRKSRARIPGFGIVYSQRGGFRPSAPSEIGNIQIYVLPVFSAAGVSFGKDHGLPVRGKCDGAFICCNRVYAVTRFFYTGSINYSAFGFYFVNIGKGSAGGFKDFASVPVRSKK